MDLEFVTGDLLDGGVFALEGRPFLNLRHFLAFGTIECNKLMIEQLLKLNPAIMISLKAFLKKVLTLFRNLLGQRRPLHALQTLHNPLATGRLLIPRLDTRQHLKHKTANPPHVRLHKILVEKDVLRRRVDGRLGDARLG